MLKKILLLVLLAFSFSIYSNIKNGSVDINESIVSGKDIINLNGEWKVSHSGKESIVNIPSTWGSGEGPYFYRVYLNSTQECSLQLLLTQISTEYYVYLNSVKIYSNDQGKSSFIQLNLHKGSNELQIKVSNSTNKFGGIRFTPIVGKFENITKIYEENAFRDLMICGASIIMFIYFFIIYFYYKSDKYNLIFSLLCLFSAVRSTTINYRVLFTYIPNISYVAFSKIEYFSIYIIPLLILLFIYSYFNLTKKLLYKILVTIGVVFLLLIAFFPAKIFMSSLYLFYSYVLISGLYVFTILIRLVKHGLKDSFKILISFIILYFSGLTDMLTYLFYILDYQILQMSTIIFISLMSLIVSQKEFLRQKKIYKLTETNEQVIYYLSKFIPNKFVDTMGVGDLSIINRGDGIERDMTVVFTTIVDFSKNIKLHKGVDTITLLNRCFSIISPIIDKHGGFIDKFIDETILALFPVDPKNAIDALIEINSELENFNNHLVNEKPIYVRSGVHCGSQFIGLVGDKERVDATVISKVVNTASRINSFNSKIGQNILISDDVFKSLDDSYKNRAVYMGKIKLKGNSSFIGIHSLYSGESTEADKLFGITMIRLENSSLDKIENVLINILKLDKEHIPSKYYLSLIRENRKLEVLEK